MVTTIKPSQLRRESDMRRTLESRWRLKPSILTAFILLTVPVFFTILAVTYLSNDTMARTNANELVERFRADAINNIQNYFTPLKTMIGSSAVVGSEQPGFYASNRSWKYFQSLLLHSPKLVAVYAGLEDGSFRQTRRIEPEVKIHNQLPPKGAVTANRLVDPKGRASEDRFDFLDAGGKDLGTSGEATTYDPRKRPWYEMAKEGRTTIITDPQVFATLGIIGFTVAAPFYHNDKLAGVTALDIKLDGLSEYLSENKISPGTLSYLLDHQGRVIANSAKARTYNNERGQVEMQHITSIQNELAAVAFGARPREHEKIFSFNHAGKDYVASLSTLPPGFGKRWQLFIITPLDDFTSGFQRNNNRLFLFGLVAIVLQIIVIFYLAGVIASPLEKLAHKVNKIQDMGTENLPSLPSSIREISILSKAIDTLDSAVKSFAAFVPVGLVKQLLESDQKLELGGHSRFLTIFFSDLESFSTLSEELPAQELLLRVSAYLELVTRAVNQEHGTIDKFIGDGVMAFWGAPALLEDHAWRSCVAAVRIQHGMKILNARWQEQGLKPLNIRIGIHSDAVLVGNIGSKERMSYTALGDGVNIAARLEGVNKEYGTRICIGHRVYNEAGERLCVRPMDDVAVKGRRAKIKIYEVMGVLGSDPEFAPSAETLRLCELTRLAYDALSIENNPLALERYRAVLKEFPHDTVAIELVKRLTA